MKGKGTKGRERKGVEKTGRKGTKLKMLDSSLPLAPVSNLSGSPCSPPNQDYGSLLSIPLKFNADVL